MQFIAVSVLPWQASYAKVEVFRTEKKGWGLKAIDSIPG